MHAVCGQYHSRRGSFQIAVSDTPIDSGTSLTPEEYMNLYGNICVPFVDPETRQLESISVRIHVYVNSTVPREHGEPESVPPNFSSNWHSNYWEMLELQASSRSASTPISNASRAHRLAIRHVYSGQGRVSEFRVYLAYALCHGRTNRGNIVTYCDELLPRDTPRDLRPPRARLGVDCMGLLRAYLEDTSRLNNPSQSIPRALSRLTSGRSPVRITFESIQMGDVIIWRKSERMRKNHIAMVSSREQSSGNLRVVQSAESTSGLNAANYEVTYQGEQNLRGTDTNYNWRMRRTESGGSQEEHFVVIGSFECLSTTE